MAQPRVRLRLPARPPVPASAGLDFQAVRDELSVPAAFPAEVEAAAARAATNPRLPAERSDVALVTVDPPGSTDLDQALHVAARTGGGYRVHYAIADLAAFVGAGDEVDAEARRRGETLYCPDHRTLLHPTVLSDGAASLLPGQDRPALLWQIDLDADGHQVGVDLRRAMVRSRARLDYAGLQAALAAERHPPAPSCCPRSGASLNEIVAARGAITLGLPDQEVVATDTGWTIERRLPLPVEGWNAHVSLLTGMAAAGLMLDAGIGILRTLPPAPQFVVDQLHHAARALRVPWAKGAGPAELVRSLDPAHPPQAALLEEAARLLRGAGYTPFDGAPPAIRDHVGVGAPYAHVTAPIRRLVDRFGSEVCVAVASGRVVPDWARQALADLPAIMRGSDNRAHRLDREVVDLTEAWLLQSRVGEVFTGAVVEADDHGTTVTIDDPPVRAPCSGSPELGTQLAVRLVAADPATRTVRFAPA